MKDLSILTNDQLQDLSALHIACWIGDHRRLYRLMSEVQYYEMVNEGDSNGWTPLHWACAGDTRGHIECAQYLLRAKAFIDKKNIAGDTPLHISILKNRLAMVKFLVEEGANLRERNAQDDTPFDLAMKLKRHNLAHLVQWGGMHVMARSAMRRRKFSSLINTWQKPVIYIIFLFLLSK